MKKAIYIFSILSIFITMPTAKANKMEHTKIQKIPTNEVKLYWDVFKKSIEVLKSYQFHTVGEVWTDHFPAYLFRFEKSENKAQHFSFIITEKWLIENNLSMTTEEEELRKLVEETFVNGALNKLNVEDMARGFHPDFAILIAKEDNLFRLPLRDWMKVVEEYRNSPEKVSTGIRNFEYTIEVLGITGNAAVVKTQFFRNNKIIITDYLSYIKYADGWKAVAKISNEHIANPLQLNL